MRILRILRVLRSVKLMRYVKDLYLLMNGFIYAFRTLFWVLFLLCLFNYVCAIFTTKVFTNVEAQQYFGTFGSSMYYLFVVLTLEKWPEIAEATSGIPNAWMFFVVYILISNFMILNLFVAVIVEHVTRASTTADVTFLKTLQEQRHGMMKSLLDLFETADTDESGTLTMEEFNIAMEKDEGVQALKNLDIQRSEVDWLFDVLDVDGDNELSVPEFMEGMMALKSSEIARSMFQLQYSVLKELKTLQTTIFANNPTAQRALDQEKEQAKVRRVETRSTPFARQATEAGTPLFEVLEDVNGYCSTLKTRMKAFESTGRHVQSLARSGEKPNDVNAMTQLKDDVLERMKSVQTLLDQCKAQVEAVKDLSDNAGTPREVGARSSSRDDPASSPRGVVISPPITMENMPDSGLDLSIKNFPKSPAEAKSPEIPGQPDKGNESPKKGNDESTTNMSN
jgi:hypothetical protein